MNQHDHLAPEQRPQSVRTIVIALVLAVLLGVPALLMVRSDQTSAAISDAERLGLNNLGAATLDIELGAGTATFDADNLAPGDRFVGVLDLRNAGSLPLRYSVTTTTAASPLTEWVTVQMWPAGAEPCGLPPATAVDHRVVEGAQALVGNPAPGGQPGDRTLVVGGAERLCFGLHVSLDAPNELQGLVLTNDLTITAEHDLEAEQ